MSDGFSTVLQSSVRQKARTLTINFTALIFGSFFQGEKRCEAKQIRLTRLSQHLDEN